MNKYLFVEYQDGGCDYTIGCGVRLTDIDAASMKEATEIFVKNVEDNHREDGILYSNHWDGDGTPDRISVYEVTDGGMLDMNAIWEKAQTEVEAREMKIKEAKEREEFERLKKKFS